jgi:hypothetical protein
MNDYIPVEGYSDLKRDLNSTAIVNTSARDYEQYVSFRERRLREINEIENLKSELSEIKDMMKMIMNKL